jgi:hypothetical protein
MDASINCPGLRCVCKHACFLAVCVFRLPSEAVIEFLRTRTLGAGCVGAIERRVRGDGVGPEEDGRAPASVRFGGLSEAEALRDALDEHVFFFPRQGNRTTTTTRYSSRRDCAEFYRLARPPEADDDCPICYNALVVAAAANGPDDDLLVACLDCGKPVHEKCVNRWMEHSSRRTCVYCRSTCWRDFEAVGRRR